MIIIRESIPFPVVHAVVLLPLDRHLLEILHICAVCDIDGSASLAAFAAFGQDICQCTIEVISAARTDPYAKIAAEFVHELTGRRQPIRKLGVEFPESALIQRRARTAGIQYIVIVVIVPSVIHDIRIQRPHFSSTQLLIDLDE